MNSLRNFVLLAFVVSLLAGVFTTGCNTIRGIGRDTERVGEKIQEKATR